MKHIIESQQFTKESLEHLFHIANELEANPKDILKGKIMASLFYEPSTRTRFSFESAMLRLGGGVVSTENAAEFSSVTKGETLEDTIRIMGYYSDVIVLRHFEEGASARAAQVSGVPVINAGDGPGQHPTQALLDLYTIQRERGKIDGASVAVIGDLKNGRTVRSLVYLLGKYENVTVHFVSPEELKVHRDILEYLDRHDVRYEEHTDLTDILQDTDVLYQTRVQKERFKEEDAKEVSTRNDITLETLEKMKRGAIIMHPLPRVDELSPDVDSSPQAVYFKQAHNGVLVRMALLHSVLA